MLYLGSHVSLNKTNGMLLGAAKEAASYGANTFMVYTGAPQNTRRQPISEFKTEEAQAFMKEAGIELFTVHAPYIVNLANTTREGHFEFAVDFLRKEVARSEAIGGKQITLHPGAHVGAGVQTGIASIIQGLNEVIDPQQNVQIALETMAGKGTELGGNFEELAMILDGVHYNDRLSITFDTCHVFDAGYDLVQDLDGVLTEFDTIIGLDRIKVLHINDSKNPSGSHKDRHANLGMGNIGFDVLNELVHLPEFRAVPKILETPWVAVSHKEKRAPYKEEIAMLRQQKFRENFLENIVQDH